MNETFITPPDQPDPVIDMPVVGVVDGDEIVSDLAGLAADLSRELFPPVTVPVPARPGWAIKVRTDLTLRELNAWRKQAGKDEIRGPLLTVVGATIGLVKDGKVVTVDGESVLFGSPELQELLGLRDVSAADCCKAFIGRDGDLNAIAVAVMQASGFGSTVEAVADGDADPTQLSASSRPTGH